jgi:hypothetical protein
MVLTPCCWSSIAPHDVELLSDIRGLSALVSDFGLLLGVSKAGFLRRFGRFRLRLCCGVDGGLNPRLSGAVCRPGRFCKRWPLAGRGI